MAKTTEAATALLGFPMNKRPPRAKVAADYAIKKLVT
jgi:hypothetical protein